MSAAARRPKWRQRDIRAEGIARVSRVQAARLERQRIAAAAARVEAVEARLDAQDEAWALLREIQDRDHGPGLQAVPTIPDKGLCVPLAARPAR
jgi:hypothetical protein